MDDTQDIIVAEAETTPEAVDSVKQAEWFTHFTGELRAQIVETEFDLRDQVIKLYHSIGQQIEERYEDFKREKVYGLHVADIIAEAVGKSPHGIRQAMRFYKKYPNLEEFTAQHGKDLSWNKIKKEYLPEPKATLESDINQDDTVPPKPTITFTFNKETNKWVLEMLSEELDTIDFSHVREMLIEHFKAFPS